MVWAALATEELAYHLGRDLCSRFHHLLNYAQISVDQPFHQVAGQCWAFYEHVDPAAHEELCVSRRRARPHRVLSNDGVPAPADSKINPLQRGSDPLSAEYVQDEDDDDEDDGDSEEPIVNGNQQARGGATQVTLNNGSESGSSSESSSDDSEDEAPLPQPVKQKVIRPYKRRKTAAETSGR